MKANVAYGLAVGVLVVVACAFVIGRGPDLNWDLQSYHYYSGYALLEGRFAEDVAPVNVPTYFHPVPNVLTYLAYSRLPFPFSSLALLALQLAIIPALVLVGREVAKSLGYVEVTPSEILAVGVGVASPMWWSELGTSFYSSTTATFAIFALWFLLRAARVGVASNAALRALGGAGLLLGVAMTLKLTNALFVVSGTVALIPILLRSSPRRGLQGLASYGFGAVLGLAAGAWWYYALFKEFGNPVYPLYNAIFRSEYFDPVNFSDTRYAFGGAADFAAFLVSAATGTSKTSEVAFADPRPLVCALLAVVALASVVLRRGLTYPPAIAVFLGFVAASWATWIAVFAYQRYILGVELLWGLVAWVLVARWFSAKAPTAIVLAVLFAASVTMMRVPDWDHGSSEARGSNAFGLELPDELKRTAAEYLIYGSPSGFVLPFLHADSHFHRIDFSFRVYPRIGERLSRYRDRPVRLIAMASMQQNALDMLPRLGYETSGACTTFRSHVGAYVTCPLRRK